VILAAPLFLFGVVHFTVTSRAAVAIAKSAELPQRDGVRVAGIGLSDPLAGMYFAPTLVTSRASRPEALFLLSMSARDHRVMRIDERTLEIGIEGGALLEGTFEQVVRAPRFEM